VHAESQFLGHSPWETPFGEVVEVCCIRACPTEGGRSADEGVQCTYTGVEGYATFALLQGGVSANHGERSDAMVIGVCVQGMDSVVAKWYTGVC
jgi:hypothetical protein